MQRKQAVLVTTAVIVMGWSVVMAALGWEDAIVALAPALAVLAQLIVTTHRSPTEPSSGHRVAAVPDEEDSAP
ncbi:hypothetical protein ACFWZA_01745 [[Kitasatospora] papulosa]|uniref:hypothetical protein n=1 Tax=Streptomyces TaxID=1883 RepID=UPI0036A76CDD